MTVPDQNHAVVRNHKKGKGWKKAQLRTLECVVIATPHRK